MADERLDNAKSSHDSIDDPTTVAPASSSDDKLRSQSTLNKHLLVPSNGLQRRSSAESIFSGSDISELSFSSTEVGSVHADGLIRTLSNVSANLNSIPAPSTWRERLQDFWVANYGAFLVLLSQMFGSLMNIATRLLETPGSHGEPMHPFQILFARQSITVMITTCYAVWTKSVPHFPLGPPGHVRLLLVSRGLFGFLGVFGFYYSLLYLPISEAIILTFLAPIGSCYAFSLLIPGEKFSRQQQIAGFVSLTGVVFIARPISLINGSHKGVGVPEPVPGNTTMPSTKSHASAHPTSAEHLTAVAVAMIGVVGAIGAMTSIRAIGQRAHALLSVNYFSAWCTFVSLVALVVLPSVKFRLPGNLTEWGLLLMLGLAGFIMQLLLTKGMAYGGAPAAEKEAPISTRVDLEMQTRALDPQMSDPLAASVTTQASPKHDHKMPQIKGSGAKATSMLYTQMLFALISDKVIFGISPGIWSWFGSGLILFGAIWVATDGGQKTAKTSAVQARTQRGRTIPPKGSSSHHEQVGLLADTEENDVVQRGIADETASPDSASSSGSRIT